MSKEVHITDRDYPCRLKNGQGFRNDNGPYPRTEKDPPQILHIRGRVDNDAAYASAIGSRDILEKDAAIAHDFLAKFFVIFAEAFKDKSLMVVSGSSPGGDEIAHETAMTEGIATTAILPTPINIPHPLDDHLYWQIEARLPAGSALISEYQAARRGERIAPQYLDRNRITAWISGMLLVYGVYRTKSGAMHTVSIASHSQIPIFFIENTVSPDVADEIINRYHAHCVKDPAEIINFFSK